MKTLLCHNYYRVKGGEDFSFEDEARLLEAQGHEVIRYVRNNAEIDAMPRWSTAWRTVWNRRTYREITELVARERPDILHCTNTFPLISPAVYDAAREAGVPVVQALRNYRLLCPSATLFRDGSVCELCVGRAVPWSSVRYGCYRESRVASGVVASMLTLGRARGQWDRVDMYYAPSEFTRQKFIAAGMPEDRIMVKPNFVAPDPGPGDGRDGTVVFVGRLTPEKGVSVVLEAFQRMRRPVRLLILGDGDLSEDVELAAAEDSRIEWLGECTHAEVLDVVGRAACLVAPSVWYEPFGRTVIEAFARGTPVVASSIGGLAELVEDGRTGYLVRPDDAGHLAETLDRLLDDPAGMARMRSAARQEYLARYTPERNYGRLLKVYESAIDHHRRNGS